MEITGLLAALEDEDVTALSRILYQQKVGSLLFAAIATRLEIAFAVSRLMRFNQRPKKQHHEAADRVFTISIELRTTVSVMEEQLEISPHLSARVTHLSLTTRWIERALRDIS